MFLALAIVCDNYLVTSLKKICKTCNLSEDVAGATLMAAGTSAPEIFVSIISVFLIHGDIGVKTIVGAALYNILFITGLCGSFTRHEHQTEIAAIIVIVTITFSEKLTVRSNGGCSLE
ncbi:sodium/potassium/calcium exchanger 4 [Tachysurus ichikawai]